MLRRNASVLLEKSTCTEWIDYEIDGHQRFDQGGIAAETADRRTHGRKVDEQRNSGEILQQDSRDNKWDLVGALRVRPPVCEAAYVVFVMRCPSQLRSTDSKTMRMLTGSFEIGPTPSFSSWGSEYILPFRPEPG